VLGKERYPVYFFLNIPCLETAANGASPVIKEISMVGEDDAHHNDSGLRVFFYKLHDMKLTFGRLPMAT